MVNDLPVVRELVWIWSSVSGHSSLLEHSFSVCLLGIMLCVLGREEEDLVFEESEAGEGERQTRSR